MAFGEKRAAIAMSGNMNLTHHSAPMSVLLCSLGPNVPVRLTGVFEAAGYSVTESDEASQTNHLITLSKYDLLVIDAPHLADGPFNIILGGQSERLPPCIVISESSGNVEEILALEMGADGFLSRPIDLRLLLSKSRALIRRANRSELTFAFAQNCQNQPWVLDTTLQMAISPDQRTIPLSPVQVRLLSVFFSNPGVLQTRDSLAKYLGGADRKSNHVTTTMSRLRRRLAENEDDAPIKTVRGHGYVYRP